MSMEADQPDHRLGFLAVQDNQTKALALIPRHRLPKLAIGCALYRMVSIRPDQAERFKYMGALEDLITRDIHPLGMEDFISIE